MSSFRITMQANNGSAELDVLDFIGRQEDGSGVSPGDVQQFLRANRGVPELIVNISSAGGNGFDGLAIYSALMEFPGRVRTVGTGIVASAAVLIYLAGSIRELAANASLMVHRASTRIAGTAADAQRAADVLSRLDQNQADIIAGRTGQSSAQVQSWLNAETWFSAQEALQYGFATQLTGNVPATMQFDLRGLTIPGHVQAAMKPTCLADTVRIKNQGCFDIVGTMAAMAAEERAILARRQNA